MTPAARPLRWSGRIAAAQAQNWVDMLQQPMRGRGTTAAYAAWLPALFARNDGAPSRQGKALAAIKVPVALIRARRVP
jgi:hypothetical protein